MRRLHSFFVLATVSLAILRLSACSAPIQPVEPTYQAINTTDFDLIWTHTLLVLRKHGFEPDRQDRVNREIVTLPATSAQWYEPWRRDVADGYSGAEASMHTMQRTVTVAFIRQTEQQPWTADVRVQVRRMNPPARQLTSASSAWNVFSARTPNEEGVLTARGGGDMQRVPLGRDGAMEMRLARAIADFQ